MGKKSRLKKQRRESVARGESAPAAPTRTVRSGVPVAVTDASFVEIVVQSPVPVLVDFWAEWCGPCKNLAPVLEQLAADRGENLRVVKYDTEKNSSFSAQLSVKSLPTLVLYNSGEVVDRRAGFAPTAELSKWIDQALQS